MSPKGLNPSQTRSVRNALNHENPTIAVELAKGLIDGFIGAEDDDVLEDEPREPSGPTRMRQTIDPEWFHEADNGQAKLTEKGVEHLYGLFDRGYRTYTAAKALGISFGAAKHRKATYDKLVAAGKRPNAKKA